MAKVEVKNERPTYTLHLNENEFWALLVAFADSDSTSRGWRLNSYSGAPEDVDVSRDGIGGLYKTLIDAAVTA